MARPDPTVGHGPPHPVPEPRLSSPFGRLTHLPSRKVDVFLEDRGVAAAYRLARRPSTTPAEVRRMYEAWCR